MTFRLSATIALIITFLAFPALALDLHAARRGGQVGERANGYAEALVHTPEVEALVKQVNAKRQQEYARIAQTKGQTVDVVAKLAAQQIINGLEAGSMYQSNGGWKKR